ncbi:MAG: prenyltransferase [Flavobacterium sp.]|nr:MAG: prenyltransferase [Flavobacterium sp.]
MHFLRVIRYQNLLMLALMQLIFRYGFLKQQNVPLALTDWQYALLILSTVCIAAGGYLINNIFDQETDRENKPEKVIVGKFIPESKAYNYYVALNVVGVGLGFYLSNVIGKPLLSSLFIVISITLYVYASSLKQTLLIGNLIVALLLSVSVLIVGVFDLYPVLTMENRGTLGLIFKILIDYAVFAFIINFIREIVKDMEDVNGDYNQGMTTLPIVLGVERTAILMFWISLIPIGILLYYINKYFIAFNLFIVTAYAMILVIAPLIYFSIKMWSARSQKDFRHLANVLKFVVFFGIISIFILTLDIRYHA